MKKTISTKRSLVASVLVLCICFTMLVGTTFAWFTDSASSAGNVIKAGTLDVEMTWAHGSEDPQNAAWQTTEVGPIFTPDMIWEPGYVAARHFKIVNNGTLALKYEMKIVTEGTVSDLADVIDVYYFSPAASLDRSAMNEDNYLGTLREVIGNVGETVYGTLNETAAEQTVTLAFKMSESAGNDYMGKEIGTSFTVMVLATQLNYESDSFDSDYDAGLIPEIDGVVEILQDGSELVYTDDGEVVLYDTASVTTDTYYVPDGVTALGNYCFAYNETIKDVVVSSSVESLGRAFDSSKVENVVLPEGLEKIDSRAFRSTSALQSVTIPSTVKVIEDNAFQKSAIKTITIPATVETIGETAFGSSLVEEVIFEGNTSVQGYAFRGTTKLRTVTFKGDNNEFIASTLNGRNSMWFCNGESNNPNTSNITFYVTNETVAARVKTAMGAEAGNTPVYVNGELYNG